LLSSRPPRPPSVGEDVGKKGILTSCWWESKLEQPLWKTIWRHLKKLKIDQPYYPETPHFLNPFISSGAKLGCFHSLAIVNSAAINMDV
jgi:hypothetical protein